MKTKGLMIINHNVPCSCACRYCFFQSSKSSNGIDYLRGEKQAKRFDGWRKQNDFDDFFLNYTISHCADFPDVFQNIRLNRSFNFIGASFLQCNGIGLKSDDDLKAYLQGVKAAGVEMIDTTFYGTKDYHDYFSSRNGDFNYMLKLLEVSSLIGLDANPSIFVCEDNKDQLDELFSILNGFSCVQHITRFFRITEETDENLKTYDSQITHSSPYRNQSNLHLTSHCTKQKRNGSKAVTFLNMLPGIWFWHFLPKTLIWLNA